MLDLTEKDVRIEGVCLPFETENYFLRQTIVMSRKNGVISVSRRRLRGGDRPSGPHECMAWLPIYRPQGRAGVDRPPGHTQEDSGTAYPDLAGATCANCVKRNEYIDSFVEWKILILYYQAHNSHT